mgnify:CR=1 FL=1
MRPRPTPFWMPEGMVVSPTSVRLCSSSSCLFPAEGSKPEVVTSYLSFPFIPLASRVDSANEKCISALAVLSVPHILPTSILAAAVL